MTRIENLLSSVIKSEQNYALLNLVPPEDIPELLTELEVQGWKLKSMIPDGAYHVRLLLRKSF